MSLEKDLSYYSKMLDLQSKNLSKDYENFIKILLSCNGQLIIFGVGKSGHIGKKISSTLTSVGMPSSFIHTTEALHGDLGLVGKNDIILIISNSGEALEFDYMLNYFHRNKNIVSCITKNKNSTLYKGCNYKLLLVEHDEICPLNTAPTTSTILTLAIGDAIAIEFMKRKQFTKEQYAIFHPSGSLGFALKKVESCYTPLDEVPSVSITASIDTIMLEMINKKKGTCVVFKDENLYGIITDGDLRRGINAKKTKISQFCNEKPSVIQSSDYLNKAVQQMNKYNINSLVVYHDKLLKGILYLDFIKQL